MFDKSGIAINETAITQIAGMAALEVDGVAGLRSLRGVGVRPHAKNPYKKAVDAKWDNGVLLLSVCVAVRGGVRLKQVAESVQSAVKDKVQTMTGNAVAAVNVLVNDVVFPDTVSVAEAAG